MIRGKKYRAAAEKVDPAQAYGLDDAVKLVREL